MGWCTNVKTIETRKSIQFDDMMVLAVLSKRAGFEDPDYLYRMDRRSFMILAAIITISIMIGVAVSIGLDKVII